MAKIKSIWSCRECGRQEAKWVGNCVTCGGWNTFDEEKELPPSQERFLARPEKTAKPIKIGEVKPGQFTRFSTKISELDRLLGGGLVAGSLSLVAGDPGIGKSTLMLQISKQLADQGLTVLYVSGEESIEQTSLRAKRLGIESPHLYLLAETLFSNIKAQIDHLKPDILIVDSIQILYKSELSSSPGSVSQVRELATEFMHLSKGMGISTFLIGHVTKSGEIAGPRVLEHLVDTVLDFDGDRQHGFRMLRAVKNRFGPTDDIALFQMSEKGLEEVTNPSRFFLEEKALETSGSVIIPTIEGSRALLIEVQALVAPSAFATSSRKSSGLDNNRLSLLLAVLEKRVGYHLHNCDVFVSVAGGLKIKEPAIDLGIIMAVASSHSNQKVSSKKAVIGEVGLGGEVRGVSRIESRIKEAINMGFEECLIPKRNLQSLSSELKKKIKITGIEFVDEALPEKN